MEVHGFSDDVEGEENSYIVRIRRKAKNHKNFGNFEELQDKRKLQESRVHHKKSTIITI